MCVKSVPIISRCEGSQLITSRFAQQWLLTDSFSFCSPPKSHPAVAEKDWREEEEEEEGVPLLHHLPPAGRPEITIITPKSFLI